MRYVIGVDGGGTKTLGVIADEKGDELARTEVGSSNIHSNPKEVVKKNLHQLISELLAKAKAGKEAIGVICLGLAGAGREKEREMIRAMVAEALPQTKIFPVTDALIALIGGTLKPFGIIVIAGTGSIALGINKEGKEGRAGGWGHILGDEGSGYMISLKALRAVCRAHDGRAKGTKLKGLILRHLNLEKPEDLIMWTRDVQADKATIGALSPLVVQAFNDGDEVAKQILEEESAELALAANAVLTKLFSLADKDVEIVVGGGNLRKSSEYFGMFQAKMRACAQSVPVIQPKDEPVVGAKIYALSKL
jgi:N-acetylglucosamine kinase-like BadF-type ATPase